MGVTGLLPVLKPIQETKSLHSYAGKCLAIDGYAWLHRAVYSCTWELAHDKPTTKYLLFFQRRVNMLRTVFKIDPYFVFDGDNFSSKAQTEESRKEARRLAKEQGMKFSSQGNSKKALEFFTKSVDVSPEIAKTVIDYLKLEGIRFVVAPYEADSQMVYLEKRGFVDGIISEDSDLLIFGCQILLTKFNEKEGTVVEVSAKNFRKMREIQIGTMSQHQLRMVACVSGCDYTNGVPRIGIKKAFQVVRSFNSMDRVILKLKLDKYTVPKEFEDEYKRADLSFLYPRVFDPETKTMATLNEIPGDLRNETNELMLECIGDLHDLEVHCEVACGDLNPITKEKLISREDLLVSLKPAVSSRQGIPNRSMQRSFSTPLSTVKKPQNFKTIDMFKFLRSSSSQKTENELVSNKSSQDDKFSVFKTSSTVSMVEEQDKFLHSTSPATKKLDMFNKKEDVPLGISKYFKRAKLEESGIKKKSKIIVDLESEGNEPKKDSVVDRSIQKIKSGSASELNSFASYSLEDDSELSELSDTCSDNETNNSAIKHNGSRDDSLATAKPETGNCENNEFDKLERFEETGSIKDMTEKKPFRILAEKFMYRPPERKPLIDKKLNITVKKKHTCEFKSPNDDSMALNFKKRRISGAVHKTFNAENYSSLLTSTSNATAETRGNSIAGAKVRDLWKKVDLDPMKYGESEMLVGISKDNHDDENTDNVEGQRPAGVRGIAGATPRASKISLKSFAYNG